jgi:ADP-ribose pyrophosphatase
VAVVALDDAGNIILVKQYRSAAAEMLLEIPAGGLEPGETPKEAATREMQEEVGLIPENLIELGYFWVAGSYDTEKITIFMADQFKASSLASDPDEQIEVIRMPFADALEMTKSNVITDAKTLIGLNWAAERLARV